MLYIRRSDERGYADHGWLKAYHSFSFANYYDPEFMGFRDLRVINEDRIQGGAGFPTHPHSDMEIVTYLVSGALEHKDNLGNSSVIRPGDAQRMSAGTGIRHSEFNHSKEETAHLLQIWILPDKKGIAPGYEQKSFVSELRGTAVKLIASMNGREGSITINQDIDLYAAKWEQAGAFEFKFQSQRYGWLQVIQGQLQIEQELLNAGDSLAVVDESEIKIKS